MPHPHGPMRKTRRFRKKPRERGLPPPGRLLIKYEIGEKVIIKINPSVHKGRPYKRFHGKIGTIVEKRGKAYVIEVTEGKKKKLVIARPEHIQKLPQ